MNKHAYKAMLHKVALFGFGLISTANINFAYAENKINMESGKHLAMACISCHNSSSKGIPVLNGVPEQLLLSKMQEYAKDMRKDTIMHQLLKGYSEQDLQNIATYFSKE
jgi:cytochrome subunit of sulfide dehydrogenase